MSQSSIQSLSILAISAGAVKSIQDHCIVSRVDCKRAIEEVYQRICEAINKWPETGNGHKNTSAITKALGKWSEQEYSITSRNKLAVLLATCQRALVDLYERLRNNRCRDMVNAILTPLRRLWDVYGADGAMY